MLVRENGVCTDSPAKRVGSARVGERGKEKGGEGAETRGGGAKAGKLMRNLFAGAFRYGPPWEGAPPQGEDKNPNVKANGC